MIITERRMLRSLQHVKKQLPDRITDKDSRFVIEATNAAITALIDAEEPINNMKEYHQRAQNITEDLQAFVKHRHNEKWCKQTTFRYKTYRITEHHYSDI